MWGIRRKDPALAPLTLSVGRIVEDFTVGLRASATKGRGAEFVGFREYQSTDSVRDIAWRASARLPDDDKLLSKEFAPERQMRVLLLADEGISMRSPALKPLYALSMARLFGLSSFVNRDPFAVIGVGGREMIFSDWLEDESTLEEFLECADDERLRSGFRPSVHSLGALVEESAPQNMLIVFLTDLSRSGEMFIEGIRSIDAGTHNVKSIAVVLDEWTGFTPSDHLVTITDPVTKKRTVRDMRRGGEVSREVERFKGRMEELKLRGRPYGLHVFTVPLAHENPMREFSRQWLRYFDD